MLLSVAQGIVNAGNDLGYPLSLYENYAGRGGMYSKVTNGIVYDDLGDLLAGVAEYAKYANDEQYETLQGELNNIARDNMGKSQIIY